MAIAEQLKLSSAEYLTGEMSAEKKHELIDGEAWAMAGASEDHNTISLNIASEIRSQLKGSPCKPFNADMKIHADGDYYYPDVSVICERDDLDTAYVKHSPRVIVEVLSKSTRNLDHGIKLNSPP